MNYHINQFREAFILQNTLTRYEIKSPCEGSERDGLPISISFEKVVFFYYFNCGRRDISILVIEKVISANKSEQVEQNYIVDDSCNSTVSGIELLNNKDSDI